MQRGWANNFHFKDKWNRNCARVHSLDIMCLESYKTRWPKSEFLFVLFTILVLFTFNYAGWGCWLTGFRVCGFLFWLWKTNKKKFEFLATPTRDDLRINYPLAFFSEFAFYGPNVLEFIAWRYFIIMLVRFYSAITSAELISLTTSRLSFMH